MATASASNVAYIAKIGPGETSSVGSGKQWPTKRFITSGECILDSLTGLMWPKNGIIGFEVSDGGALRTQPDYANTNASLNQIKWESAATAIINMNNAGSKLCGYSDWRLPNVIELKSLLNYAASTPANWLMYGTGSSGSPACSGACFANVQASRYWSSSTFASTTSGALVVYFNNGNVNAYGKDLSSYVWPVRGGQ